MKINIAGLRKDYTKKELKLAEVNKDPFKQFDRWFDDAINAQVMEPNAMTLSTITEENRPSSRTVLLKGLSQHRFVFYTNYNSRKGHQLGQNPFAALTFFWPELERQINIEGTVEKVPETESDEYFDSRPYKSRVGAWSSPQSQRITSKEVITKSFLSYSLKFTGQKVPRPPHWGGYAVLPHRIEFWQGRPSRLHDRILYTKEDNNVWEIIRLAP